MAAGKSHRSFTEGWRVISTGSWILRISLLINVSVLLYFLGFVNPNATSQIAGGLFAFEADPTRRALYLYGTIFGIVTLTYLLAERSIKKSALEDVLVE